MGRLHFIAWACKEGGERTSESRAWGGGLSIAAAAPKREEREPLCSFSTREKRERLEAKGGGSRGWGSLFLA